MLKSKSSNGEHRTDKNSHSSHRHIPWLHSACYYCHELSVTSGERLMWLHTGLNSIIYPAELLPLSAK